VFVTSTKQKKGIKCIHGKISSKSSQLKVDAASTEEKLIKSKFGNLDVQESLKKLDAFLEDKSYLCVTQSCTKLDVEAYRMTQSVNLEGFNNVLRWRKHIASFENDFAVLKSGSL